MRTVVIFSVVLALFSQAALAENNKSLTNSLQINIEKELTKAEQALSEIESLRDQLTQLKMKRQSAKNIRNLSLTVSLVIGVGSALLVKSKRYPNEIGEDLAVASVFIGYPVAAGALLVAGGSQAYLQFNSDKIESVESALALARTELINEMAKNQATLDAIK